MENRFTAALEPNQPESGERKRMDETLSQAREETEVGNTPDRGAKNGEFSRIITRELLQELSGDDWANTATTPLGSPRKNLELPLTSEPSNMVMVLLTDEAREENTFEGNKDTFLSKLDEEAWRSFLDEFNQRVETKLHGVDEFKEELWSTVVKFGEPVLIGTGLDEKGREGLLEKMIGLRKQKQDAGANPCEDNSTLNRKTDNKKLSAEVDDKCKTSNRIKNTNILKAREKGGKSWKIGTWERSGVSVGGENAPE